MHDSSTGFSVAGCILACCLHGPFATHRFIFPRTFEENYHEAFFISAEIGVKKTVCSKRDLINMFMKKKTNVSLSIYIPVACVSIGRSRREHAALGRRSPFWRRCRCGAPLVSPRPALQLSSSPGEISGSG